MTTALQHRRGTTSEHATFTGLEGEVTIDTTKDTAVVHDGSTAGGIPLARENLSNVSTSGLASIDGASTASDDKFFVYDQSATTLKTITRAELNNAMEQDTLADVDITGGTINGTSIGATTASSGAFTTLSASGNVTLGDASTDTLNVGNGGLVKDASGNVGLGVSPSAWGSGRPTLQLGGSVQGTIAYTGTGSPSNGLAIWNNAYYGSGGSGTSNYYVNNGTATIANIGGANAFNIATATSGTAGNVASFTNALTLDTSGNLGLGVSPSAWGAGQKSFDVGSAYGLNASSTGGASFSLSQNAYYNGTNWIYKNNNPAARYDQNSGVHVWHNATSGTAGNAITFTQAMTLNASSNLLLVGGIAIGNVSYTDGIGVKFPAAQVASSDANTLDDYEEGSFTLTLSDSAGNNATMGAGNTWRYIKIGRAVTIAGTLVWSSTSALTAGSRIRLTGLPFTSDGSNTAIRSPCAVGSSEPSSFNIVTSAVKFGIDAGVSYIWGTNVTGNNVDGAMYKADLGNSGVLYGIFVTYLATA